MQLNPHLQNWRTAVQLYFHLQWVFCDAILLRGLFNLRHFMQEQIKQNLFLISSSFLSFVCVWTLNLFQPLGPGMDRARGVSHNKYFWIGRSDCSEGVFQMFTTKLADVIHSFIYPRAYAAIFMHIVVRLIQSQLAAPINFYEISLKNASIWSFICPKMNVTNVHYPIG